MRDTATIWAVMTSDCRLYKPMQVEIRLAAAISSTVMNKNTPDDARALAAADSNKPIVHLWSTSPIYCRDAACRVSACTTSSLNGNGRRGKPRLYRRKANRQMLEFHRSPHQRCKNHSQNRQRRRHAEKIGNQVHPQFCDTAFYQPQDQHERG